MNELIDLTDAWEDWRKTCQLAKCSAENQKNLCTVSNRIFCSILSKYKQKGKVIPFFRPEEFMSFVNVIGNESFSFVLMESTVLPETKSEQERRTIKNEAMKGRTDGELNGYFLRFTFENYIKKMWLEEKKNTSKYLFEPENNRNEDWIENTVAKDGYDMPFSASTDPRKQIDKSVAEKAAEETVEKFFFQNINQTGRIALWASAMGIPLKSIVDLELVDLKHSAFSALPRKIVKEYSELIQHRVEQSQPSPKKKPEEGDEDEEDIETLAIYWDVSCIMLRDYARKWGEESREGKALSDNPDIKPFKKYQ